MVRGLPLGGLDLYPAAARAGSISRLLPLRDNALEAETCALCQQVAGVGKGLAVSDQIAVRAREQGLKPRTPLDKRLLAEIAALKSANTDEIESPAKRKSES